MNPDKFSQVALEYQDFCLPSEADVPSPLANRVKKNILSVLNPSGMHVFFKLMGIHLLCSIVTLMLCPQFGVTSLPALKSLWLVLWLSHLGSFACTMICGGLYLGVSIFTAVLVFSREEYKKLRQLLPLQVLVLILVSLGFFMMMRAVIVLEFALVWSLGAFLGARIFIELALRLRQSYRDFVWQGV